MKFHQLFVYLIFMKLLLEVCILPVQSCTLKFYHCVSSHDFQTVSNFFIIWLYNYIITAVLLLIFYLPDSTFQRQFLQTFQVRRMILINGIPAIRGQLNFSPTKQQRMAAKTLRWVQWARGFVVSVVAKLHDLFIVLLTLAHSVSINTVTKLVFDSSSKSLHLLVYIFFQFQFQEVCVAWGFFSLDELCAPAALFRLSLLSTVTHSLSLWFLPFPNDS